MWVGKAMIIKILQACNEIWLIYHHKSYKLYIFQNDRLLQEDCHLLPIIRLMLLSSSCGDCRKVIKTFINIIYVKGHCFFRLIPSHLLHFQSMHGFWICNVIIWITCSRIWLTEYYRNKWIVKSSGSCISIIITDASDRVSEFHQIIHYDNNKFHGSCASIIKERWRQWRICLQWCSTVYSRNTSRNNWQH